MGEMNNFITVLIGVIIRIGVPIGISVLVFILLKKFDIKWQKEANFIPVLSKIGKPCWEVKGCTDEKRNSCPVSNQPKVPCWQTFRAKSGTLKDTCLECDVFRGTLLTI